MIITPSILNAKLSNLQQEILTLEQAGADWFHLDVMDGNFVPPISFGAALVKEVKAISSLPLDVHLMVLHPETHIEDFVQAGATSITIHQEACPHLHRIIQQIKSYGIKVGVAINPATPVELLSEILSDIDLVLIMSINPGWGGQKFIPNTLSKISLAKKMLHKINSKALIQIDGGINPETAKSCQNSGADVFVVGNYITSSSDYKKSINNIRQF